MENWISEIKRVFVALTAALLIGFIFEKVLLFLVLTLGGYLLINIFQTRRLYKWLVETPREGRNDPPESIGLWGDIFDGIYKLQKKEREASIYLENIFEKAQASSAALEIAVIMIDTNGNLDWWNRASKDLLGLQYPQDSSQPVTNLIRDPRFTEYFNAETYTETLKLNAPRDNTKVLEFQIARFGENERLMLVRDITQLHQLELMRTDFVGNVSHELGTPITVIKGYIEALLANTNTFDEKWARPIKQMQNQTTRMENLVNDLLLLSSLETKAMPGKKDTCNLLDILTLVTNDTQNTFSRKDHEYKLSCSSSIEIEGDSTELQSAISNLASNAAKYTKDNGLIEIGANIDRNTLNIFVKDNGVGIINEHIPRLTERFYRVDTSRSSETGGTGLGLAIVKHILIRHDAELEIHSYPGQGSCFTCKFPKNMVSTL